MICRQMSRIVSAGRSEAARVPTVCPPVAVAHNDVPPRFGGQGQLAQGSGAGRHDADPHGPRSLGQPTAVRQDRVDVELQRGLEVQGIKGMQTRPRQEPGRPIDRPIQSRLSNTFEKPLMRS